MPRARRTVSLDSVVHLIQAAPRESCLYRECSRIEVTTTSLVSRYNAEITRTPDSNQRVTYAIPPRSHVQLNYIHVLFLPNCRNSD